MKGWQQWFSWMLAQWDEMLSAVFFLQSVKNLSSMKYTVTITLSGSVFKSEDGVLLSVVREGRLSRDPETNP